MGGNADTIPAFTLSQLHLEDAMERELTPVEARGGVINGRVVTVLALSFLGSEAGAWAIIGMPQ